MNNDTGGRCEGRMRFLLLGVSDQLGLTDQRFFEALPEAEREAHAMEVQSLQPYLFRLTPVPISWSELPAADWFEPPTRAAISAGSHSEVCAAYGRTLARAGDEISDDDFWPLCFACGHPVNPKIGWVRYDDGRVYHKACDGS